MSKPFKKCLDPSQLTQVDVGAVISTVSSGNRPERAYVDKSRGWVVQVYSNKTPLCDGTPWEGTLCVSIKHSGARNLTQYDNKSKDIPITWDEIQAIKDHFWPNRIAIEVYPRNEDIVNVANMRWIWVLPESANLPFTIKG